MAFLLMGLGSEGPVTVDDSTIIATSFREIDLILDGGPGGIEPTTVIDLTQNPPVIVRAGAGPIDVL